MRRDNPAEEGGKSPVWVAIYTRKSNDENLTGEVTSLESQRGCCRSYIEIQKAKGWQEFPEAFDDPAESGKSLKRPAMRRLLKAVEEGKVQGVIVYKLDRLTRNSRDFHALLELFEKHNVAFISATESIDTKSPQGRLMTAIMVQFAQYDREMDVERSKDFHLARARKGLWCAGQAPLGYDLKDKLLVVNEAEVEIVRQIFSLYLKSKSTLRVAEQLNRLGFRRKISRTLKGKVRGGKPFDMDTVIRILQRKVYIGLITNARTGLEFPGQHAAIISPAIFEQAQKLLASNNQRRGPTFLSCNKHRFRLKGLVRCGECKGAVIPYTRPKKKKVYLYYRCLPKTNGLPSDCAFKSIGAQKLEEYIIEKLAAVGYDRPLLERVVRKIDELSKTQLAPLEQERRNVGDRLKAIRQEIQNLLNVVKAQGNQDVADELAKLGASKREIEGRLGELEARIGHTRQAVYDVDAVQGAFQRFAHFIYRIPLELQIRTINLLVKQVVLFKDRLKVQIHELPIPDLQRSLDARIADGRISGWESRRLRERRDQKPTAQANGARTAVGILGQTGGADGI